MCSMHPKKIPRFIHNFTSPRRKLVDIIFGYLCLTLWLCLWCPCGPTPCVYCLLEQLDFVTSKIGHSVLTVSAEGKPKGIRLSAWICYYMAAAKCAIYSSETSSPGLHVQELDSATMRHYGGRPKARDVDRNDTCHLSPISESILAHYYYYYYTCIYNVHTFSSGTESEVLGVTRWAAW